MTQEEPKPGSRERNLIEEALRQAGARSDPPVEIGEELPPAETFPGYDLIREIHRGGQGVVYLAVQRATKRRVAIKVMHEGPFAGSSGRARFEREVQVLGQLNHPNIVHIHDSGTTPSGGFYYVMDYVSGKGLDELIAGRSRESGRSGRSGSSGGSVASGRLDGSIEESLRLFAKICTAVNAAHLKGVIHRDLKPSNIRVDANGDPVVVDFGLARVAVPDAGSGGYPMTMTGQFIGSLPWASPEQAEGVPDRIDVRTDVYSLGVILYQMLTGAFPYQVVGNMRDVLDNILRAEPARPSTVRKQVNDEVETIVLKCLHKDRDRRYQTAGEVARDIQRYLAGEPIEAKRDSGMYVLRKTLKRYAWQSGVAAGAVVGLVVFAVVVTVLWSEAGAARRAADLAATGERSQREKAEANAQSVRAMSRTIVGRLNQALRDLPATTALREQLLSEVESHLTRLSGEAKEDPSLDREVAETHDLLGDVSGGLVNSSLGDSARALKHYEEASRIRSALLATRPSDPRAIGDAAQSWWKIGGMRYRERRVEDAKAAYEEAIDGYARALNATGLASADRNEFADERAGVQADLANLHTRVARQAPDPAAATAAMEAALDLDSRILSHWEARARSTPEDAEAVRQAVAAQTRLARHLYERHGQRWSDGVPGPGKGSVPSPEESERAVERLNSARQIAAAAVSRIESYAEHRPWSIGLRRDLYLAHLAEGNASSRAAAADREAVASGALDAEASTARSARAATAERMAAASFEKAVSISQQVARLDPANVGSRREEAVAQKALAGERYAMGDLDGARDASLRSVELRRRLRELDAIATAREDLGAGLADLGAVLQALGEDEGREPEARLRSLEAAVAAYAECMEIFAELDPQGRDARYADAVSEIRRRLSACEEMGKTLRSGER